jgi:hypothetical protein
MQDEWVVCRVFDKTTGVKRASALPSYNLDMLSGGIEQSSIIPMTMPSNFTMDTKTSCYSTIGASSSMEPHMMPPLAGMGNIDLQANNTLFQNSMVMAPQMSVYHQMGLGVVGASGFMAAAKSGPSLMVSQKEIGIGHEQPNVSKMSQVVFANPEFVPTMDMDGIWKY